MKFKFVFMAFVFFISQGFGSLVFADKYQDAAEDYVAAFNLNIENMAKIAAVSQLNSLGANIANGIFSPLNQDQLIQAIDANAILIIDSANTLLAKLKVDPVGEINLDEARVNIHQLLTEITNLSSKMHRLSWILRDQMDSMYGANDWLIQAINGYQSKCSLGYYNFENTVQLDTTTEPPGFKTDLNMFFGVSTSFGDSGGEADGQTNYVTQNQVSAHSLNYMNDDIKHLQEAQTVTNYATTITGGTAVSLAVNGGTALGAGAGAWGTAAAVSFGVGVAIAAAIYIVGSYEAYKEQKKWARAEVYKFLKSFDTDDFSRIYRKECAKFSDNLNLLKDIVVKYQTNSEFKSSIDTEVEAISYGECRTILDKSLGVVDNEGVNNPESEAVSIESSKPVVDVADPDNKEATPADSATTDSVTEQSELFTEDKALAVFKYYQCATQVHGPKLFADITSEKIIEISSRLSNLRSYLSEYIFIVSKLKNEFSGLIVHSEAEIKIDRLYKNLVVAATGLILGLNTAEDYFYQKKSLQNELDKTSDMLLLNRDDIQSGMAKVEFHVKDYIPKNN